MRNMFKGMSINMKYVVGLICLAILGGTLVSNYIECVLRMIGELVL